jgi:hypothetical protein
LRFIADWTYQPPPVTPYYPNYADLPTHAASPDNYNFFQQPWIDNIYNALDRSDDRLGPIHQQSQDSALLDPGVQSLLSWEVSQEDDPFAGPFGLDSANINPAVLNLPIDEPDQHNHPSTGSVKCPDCGKSFTGTNAVKNRKCV